VGAPLQNPRACMHSPFRCFEPCGSKRKDLGAWLDPAHLLTDASDELVEEGPASVLRGDHDQLAGASGVGLYQLLAFDGEGAAVRHEFVERIVARSLLLLLVVQDMQGTRTFWGAHLAKLILDYWTE
jgi:hypothetical protein